jgi:SlyX protein
LPTFATFSALLAENAPYRRSAPEEAGRIMEERFTELENRYTHHELIIQELLDTVFRQQQDLDRVKRDLEQLREQMQLVLPSLVGRPEDEEPPPHY